MAVFMLSLGGIPPMAGFMGKLFIFRPAVDAGLVGLVIVGRA
jgi:NADH-quinone oxidoreductase subunit N